jgi:hypothetical protein
MKYISVLTPPFLVAVIVLIAVIAFVRHEMGRGHTHQAGQEDDIPPDAVQPRADDGNKCQTESGRSDATATEG